AGIDAIVREADGHPLFISTLVQQRRIRQPVRRAGRLDDILSALVEHVEPAPRRVLAMLAVAGRPLSRSTAAAAAGVSLDRLATLVAELYAARLATAAGPRAGDPVDVYHDRVREAALALV